MQLKKKIEIFIFDYSNSNCLTILFKNINNINVILIGYAKQNKKNFIINSNDMLNKIKKI